MPLSCLINFLKMFVILCFKMDSGPQGRVKSMPEDGYVLVWATISDGLIEVTLISNRILNNQITEVIFYDTYIRTSTCGSPCSSCQGSILAEILGILAELLKCK